MPPRNRPTAFELSFGDSGDSRSPTLSREVSVASNSLYGTSTGRQSRDVRASTSHGSQLRSQATLIPSGSGSQRPPLPRASPLSRASSVTAFEHDEPHHLARSLAKRKAQGDSSSQPDKRSRVENEVKYLDPSALMDCLLETADTIVVGEEEPGEDSNGKPIRLLTDFTLFDTTHNNRHVSFQELLKEHGVCLEMVGNVGPVYANEEDAGQDCEAEHDDAQFASTSNLRIGQLQKFHTSEVVSFAIDYQQQQGPVYVETEHAYYMLGKPSKRYKDLYRSFYSPHRAAQIVISAAVDASLSSLVELEGSYDELLGGYVTKKLLKEAYSTIVTVSKNPEYQRIRQSPLIRDIISQAHSMTQPLRHLLTTSTPIPVIGNIDLLVLRPEKQNNTVVTPHVAGLAQGLFKESLRVMGSKSYSPSQPPTPQQWLRKWLHKWLALGKQVEFEPGRTNFCLKARVNHCEYEVGDVVAVPAASYGGRESLQLPKSKEEIERIPADRTPADYLWFGRILFINRQDRTAHVQWFEHSSKTLLQEIHDPNELFTTETCGSIELGFILKKCTCHFVKARNANTRLPEIRNCWKSLEFYYSYSYNQGDGTFVQADEHTTFPLPGNPPDNCPVCAKAAAREVLQTPQIIEKGSGVAIGGYNYHLNDYAMVESDGGPCLIGKIINIKSSSKARDLGACEVSLQLLGRVRVMVTAAKEDLYQDEQELFLTNELQRVDAKKLLKPCRVKAAKSFSSLQGLQTYINSSPTNFYVCYHAEQNDLFSWQRRTELPNRALPICAICHTQDQAVAKEAEDFGRTPVLRAFDPFAGTGAFALSMQEAGILKLTHAVEISPSAAKTLKRNSPNTVVYNQCANLVLENAIKKARSIENSPKLLSIEGQELPDMIKPSDVDCVVAGFPCQPHSTLNMYQRANDKKSHLILNLLSWIDFLKPRHCFFENVRGFIHYGLNTTQQDRYKLKGGIPVGGIKFLVYSLLSMGYQVRFSLLQAAHYGTPQARVRFFLIATRIGHTLPSFPTPMYHLPPQDSLTIKFPHGLTVSPIPRTTGAVPHDYISVKDAISDLEWFDWRNPLNKAEQPRKVGGKEILLKSCNRQKPTCGMSQPATAYRYAEPRTRYQTKARVRQEAITDLQHYTRPLKEDTVARVTYIKLEPGADFNCLFEPHVPRSLISKEWQLSNPSSAVARRGFKDGFYGRLDEKKWFHTTVTNVEPMAKQSWVLNPWCKRVLTVRELARSQGFPDDYEFLSVKEKDVKTMHREIGNAVPWPVGLALGRELWEAEFKDWKERKSNAIVVD